MPADMIVLSLMVRIPDGGACESQQEWIQEEVIQAEGHEKNTPDQMRMLIRCRY